MRIVDLYWLPAAEDFAADMRRVMAETPPRFSELVRLAGTRLDFLQTNRLDKSLQKLTAASDDGAKSLKLAVLSSSTADHLLPALRVAAARRNLRLTTLIGDYGMYLHELRDASSRIHEFKPNVLLFAFHAQHLLGNPDATLSREAASALIDDVGEKVREIWRLARKGFKGQLIQQTVLPTLHALLGMNEHRLPGSGAQLIERLNLRLRELADEERVDILALDRISNIDGLHAWHDPMLWLRAKQEISPTAAPGYGDLVLRLIAAQQGRSAKCLVLDLDNTLWGGVIGDDGLEGIKLGQGSALGEAFVEFQTYARDLARRGVILAVCSKNDLENAQAPFERHPEMVLKMEHIACFVANWSDKAGNLRAIAEQLNIGIDSLVFADDNPFERNIVRRELPMVSVPELGDEPALYASTIAAAGYFEGLQVTAEDLERGSQYRANAARENLRASHTDLEGYLKTLDMELRWQPFDLVGLQRIVQLINKTNQFNLRTARYTEDEVRSLMALPGALTLQLRLLDQFGDNGIIGIVIGKLEGSTLMLDTWLMSCRVLGRQVEEATLNLVAAEAERLGALQLRGEYLPTKKNGMVREHYRKLKFENLDNRDGGASTWGLTLAHYTPFPTFIRICRSTT